MKLALDHLTVMDTTPINLVRAAEASHCEGFCLFMQSLEVLPRMPLFNLIESPTEQRDLKAMMQTASISLDVAYPFTLAGRTEIKSFQAGLECAAFLEAEFVNALIYDRDDARREDNFLIFTEMAQQHGLKVVVEFFPGSQIMSLADALTLVSLADRPYEVGVNVDLLHLMRSGSTLEDLRAAPDAAILYAQICDAPLEPHLSREVEASAQRCLIGEGDFDVAGFMAALPSHCQMSVEIPREDAILGGQSVTQRAQQAVKSVKQI
ncbi:domain containing protein [Candidatus Micropelagos thuwalensis]|uniref:Domain containing protein n=2 Tax=Candidatus Micropelagius thuwalensis TaxID=1397666 RepID=U2XM05_9PROT|nr:domain containing protein [Candidatus Micropelagos thuwalensis]